MARMLRFAVLGCLLLAAVGAAGCSVFDPPPVANFESTPSDPLARSDVQFRDLSTDSGFLSTGGVVSWTWDFDDSGTSQSPSPQHKYDRSGPYDVQLTVEDQSGGKDTAERTITVRPSLAGTWTGTLDDNGFPLGLMLYIQHSPTGGIGGTGTWAALSLPIFSASLVGTQVTITFTGNRVLMGALDSTDRGMSGMWSRNGVIGGTWTAQLQG